ncbi:hypothetical protein [Luteimonas suaedae]|uniref:hypothetical protein n=1 Tax=Luteimonas suaedae TaxID=2605430 RepID=UPI0011EF2AC1|nr:hypothetical protein [Luteimonas suaedae]
MSRHLYFLLLCGLVLALPLPGASQNQEKAPLPVAERDGQHDFDFEFGTWTTHIKRLQNPLSGATAWVEYEGTTTVRKLLDGRANTAELEVEGESGRIEGVALRLYDPQARQWRIHYANIADGELTGPVTGAFRDGRGEFYGQETINGRVILVRFVISDITKDSCHFEQAFSVDGGRTWEVNWIATDTRRAPNAP